METAIVTAVISAIVSLSVTLITVLVSRSSIRAERERLELELQRQMTAKLYDLRLETYPKAMAITEGLRKSRIRAVDEAERLDHFSGIQRELDDWHSTKAAFILSREALYKLYDLRKALRMKPKQEGRYAKEQIDKIWRAKGAFRAALWSDMHLLFNEDIGDLDPDD